MELLLFAGSLRSGSLNKKLLKIAADELAAMPSCTVTVIDIRSLDIPVYDGDIEAQGIPAGVKKLGELIQKAQGVVIASPEYNGSISSPLKNTVDWVSRLRPIPLAQKPVLLMGASPGAFGASQALVHARTCFERLSAYVYPQGFALAKAGEAFEDDGRFKDPAQKERLQKSLTQYLEFAKKLNA